MEILGWITNGLAIVGWIVNIKYRKYAMMIFTCATILSIVYFYFTSQAPFLIRSIFYLVIDFVTILHIVKSEFKNC